MAAPKGNEFWKLQSKHGRDKLFATPELIWEAATEYFQYCVDNPLMSTEYVGKDATMVLVPKVQAFTLQGLCLYIGCSTAHFRNVKSTINAKEGELSELDKAFLTIITRIEETVYHQKFINAAAGFLKENIIARDLGLTEKTDNTNNNIIVTVADE